jgi:hypothetical protein
MSLAAENEYLQVGQTPICPEHDRDLIHELSTRLDALRRYEQYFRNAEGSPEVQSLWTDFKRRDEADIQRLRNVITEEMHRGCI